MCVVIVIMGAQFLTFKNSGVCVCVCCGRFGGEDEDAGIEQC